MFVHCKKFQAVPQGSDAMGWEKRGWLAWRRQLLDFIILKGLQWKHNG